MFLVSDNNLGSGSMSYIVRAVFDHDVDGEWEEDITLVWVKHVPSGVDAMHHTLAYGTTVYAQDNEHDAVSQWMQDKLNNTIAVEHDDLTLYKSFNLIEI